MKELEERLLDYELGLLDTPEGLEHFKQRIRDLFKQQQSNHNRALAVWQTERETIRKEQGIPVAELCEECKKKAGR